MYIQTHNINLNKLWRALVTKYNSKLETCIYIKTKWCFNILLWIIPVEAVSTHFYYLIYDLNDWVFQNWIISVFRIHFKIWNVNTSKVTAVSTDRMSEHQSRSLVCCLQTSDTGPHHSYLSRSVNFQSGLVVMQK